MGYVHPYCSCILNVFIPTGFVTIRVNLDHCVCDIVHGCPPEVGLFPSGSGACWNRTFDIQLVWLIGLSFGVF